MTAKEILEELKPLGHESYKRVLVNNHGIQAPDYIRKVQQRGTIGKKRKTVKC